MYKQIVYVLIVILFLSCKEKRQVNGIVTTWQNKTVTFPKNITYNFYGKYSAGLDMHNNHNYKILNYIDTSGCTGCKLQLPQWLKFINKIDSLAISKIPVLFFFHVEDYKEVINILQLYNFDYPVCFDYQDSLNKLNHFPADTRFQTFLLDSTNRVKVIGNPIHNPKVKELYLKVITGDTTAGSGAPQTTVFTEVQEIDMKRFPVKESRKVVFTLVNTGQRPLIISGITTSCGCASVDYDKQPVKPGDKLNVTVEMKPENTGYFEKTISVYCNTGISPIVLRIKGQAE